MTIQTIEERWPNMPVTKVLYIWQWKNGHYRSRPLLCIVSKQLKIDCSWWKMTLEQTSILFSCNICLLHIINLNLYFVYCIYLIPSIQCAPSLLYSILKLVKFYGIIKKTAICRNVFRPSLKKCLFAVTRPTHKICPYSNFFSWSG
jgi:hypothetical protein